MNDSPSQGITLPPALVYHRTIAICTSGESHDVGGHSGYAASAAVLATFCMSTMIPLRILALGSNVLFMAYGYVDHLYPVFILHAILFPVNALRLVQFQRLVRDIRDAHREDLSIQSLLPYMKRRRLEAGEILVRKGDKADQLYYLLDGELEVVELNKILKAWRNSR